KHHPARGIYAQVRPSPQRAPPSFAPVPNLLTYPNANRRAARAVHGGSRDRRAGHREPQGPRRGETRDLHHGAETAGPTTHRDGHGQDLDDRLRVRSPRDLWDPARAERGRDRVSLHGGARTINFGGGRMSRLWWFVAAVVL